MALRLDDAVDFLVDPETVLEKMAEFAVPSDETAVPQGFPITAGNYFQQPGDGPVTFQAANALPQFQNSFVVAGHYDATLDRMRVGEELLDVQRFAQRMFELRTFGGQRLVVLVAGASGAAREPTPASEATDSFAARLAAELSALTGDEITVLAPHDDVLQTDIAQDDISQSRPGQVRAGRFRLADDTTMAPDLTTLQLGNWIAFNSDGRTGVFGDDLVEVVTNELPQRLRDQLARIYMGIRPPADGYSWMGSVTPRQPMRRAGTETGLSDGSTVQIVPLAPSGGSTLPGGIYAHRSTGYSSSTVADKAR